MIMRLRVLFASLMMFLTCTNVAAQQTATVKSFSMTTDHIPGADRRNDNNGVACALIKVQVLDDIERVEGNKIGDIVNKGTVEKWVYMCKGSRNIRIHLKNHLPVKVMFQDYQINGLESNRVYELVIEASKPVAQGNVDVKGNNLQLRVTPCNATVYLWGDNMEKKAYRPQDDGTLIVHLPYGRYHYQAQANGYNDKEGSVFVNDENRWESIALETIKGGLTVLCPTDGAELYVNNQLVMRNGKAGEWTVSLAPGQYQIEARKKGHAPTSKTVTVSANQNSRVLLENLVSEADIKKLERQKQKEIEEKAKAEAAEKERKAKEEAAAREAAIAKQKKEEQEKKRQAKREALKKELTEKESRPVVFGIAAGYNMATAQFSSENSGETKGTGGFHAGLTADFKLAQNFFIKSGLLYSAKGYKYKNDKTGIDETANPQFAEIPVQASVRLPLGDQVKMEFNAGPYVAFCISGNVKDNNSNGGYDEKFSSAYSSLDYGMQAGIGFNILYNFHVGVNYQIGMASDYSNKNLMISIGYRF